MAHVVQDNRKLGRRHRPQFRVSDGNRNRMDIQVVERWLHQLQRRLAERVGRRDREAELLARHRDAAGPGPADGNGAALGEVSDARVQVQHAAEVEALEAEGARGRRGIDGAERVRGHGLVEEQVGGLRDGGDLGAGHGSEAEDLDGLVLCVGGT